ncbi:2-amino-4-hydroxy-6-hydroxymethyldihydropteridine diphosphokinase [Hirschia litorea]|uniref:2-amino-4-hydroxy-6-hydroxymethyldihydropteridine pyrophosphokinase n=1 Tax=Hirschia litorea TaxID=1199156 RepID=A0ABW2IHQ0_9PROT
MSLPATRVSKNGTSESTRGQGRVYVALGSNAAFTDDNKYRLEGAGLFQSVLHALQRAGIVTLQKSSLWLSPAWPDPTLGDFYNAVVELALSDNNAQALMLHLLALEDEFGRKRSVKNASRTLDLDLIDYRQIICNARYDGDLILPHPRLHERSFVLSPLLEIAPNWYHPVLKCSGAALEKNAQNEWPATKIGSF